MTICQAMVKGIMERWLLYRTMGRMGHMGPMVVGQWDEETILWGTMGQWDSTITSGSLASLFKSSVLLLCGAHDHFSFALLLWHWKSYCPALI
jgi:hypothetical protein